MQKDCLLSYYQKKQTPKPVCPVLFFFSLLTFILLGSPQA